MLKITQTAPWNNFPHLFQQKTYIKVYHLLGNATFFLQVLNNPVISSSHFFPLFSHHPYVQTTSSWHHCITFVVLLATTQWLELKKRLWVKSWAHKTSLAKDPHKTPQVFQQRTSQNPSLVPLQNNQEQTRPMKQSWAPDAPIKNLIATVQPIDTFPKKKKQ